MSLHEWLCPVCDTYRPTSHTSKMEKRLEEYRNKIIREFLEKCLMELREIHNPRLLSYHNPTIEYLQVKSEQLEELEKE